MFAYANEDYRNFKIEHYDPSCRKGIKTILKSEIEELKFNSKNKALEFLNLNNVSLQNGMIINGYTVIIP